MNSKHLVPVLFLFFLGACHSYGSTPFSSRVKRIINVKDAGAKGDGKTDDTKAINHAISMLNGESGTIYFPNGVYPVSGAGVLLQGTGIRLAGESREHTVIRGDKLPVLLSTGASTLTDSLVIRSIRFDGTDVSSHIIRLQGAKLQGPTLIADCYFYNGKQHAIFLNGVKRATIAKNTFRASAPGDKNTSVYVYDGSADIHILDNRFLYVYNAVYVVGKIVAGGQAQLLTANRNITFRNNYVDLGWYLLPPSFSAQSSKIRYFETRLIDTKANLPVLSNTAYVRVLKPMLKGRTGYTVKANRLTDKSANFIQSGIRPKDVMRIGDVFGVIQEVGDEHNLTVEKWIRQSDMADVAAFDKKPYLINRLILGAVQKNTLKEVVVDVFLDFSGRRYVPEENWPYEILNNEPNYPFFASANNSSFTIEKNTFKRGWSDQVSLFCDSSLIADNLIEDGQDIGITVHGENHSILNNTIREQKTSGIWLNCSNSKIEGNTLTDIRWGWPYTTQERGYIDIYRSQNNIIQNNRFIRVAVPKSQGIVPLIGRKNMTGKNKIDANAVIETKNKK